MIRYDNRDTGRSTRLADRGHPRRMLVRAFAGPSVRAPYTLADMADDALRRCSTTSASTRAHVVGVSMGGMIAQTMAIARPEPGALA